MTDPHDRSSWVLAALSMAYAGVPLGAAESGRIISAMPSEFRGGRATTITVRVENTGDSDDMLIRHASAPTGWSIQPLFRNPFMPSNTFYDAEFTVIPADSGGQATILWEFLDDDFLSNDLVDQRMQAVSVIPSGNHPPSPPGSLDVIELTPDHAIIGWGESTDPDGDAVLYEVDG